MPLLAVPIARFLDLPSWWSIRSTLIIYRCHRPHEHLMSKPGMDQHPTFWDRIFEQPDMPKATSCDYDQPTVCLFYSPFCYPLTVSLLFNPIQSFPIPTFSAQVPLRSCTRLFLFCSRSSKNIGQISQDLTPYPDMSYLKCHTSSSKSSPNGTTEKYKYQKQPRNLV